MRFNGQTAGQAVVGWSAVLMTCLFALRVYGVEIHSNGRGGGSWSDPATWHGGVIPSATDTVTVATDDTVVFDGHSPEKTTCRQIQIDPHGVLQFKADSQPHTLSVSGPIESYGTLRMDGRKSPDGALEVRLVADRNEDRFIRLRPNSRIYLTGEESIPGSRNVRITAGNMVTNQTSGKGLITAKGGVVVDIEECEISDVVLELSMLDNTGFKSNERLTLMGNIFSGQSRALLNGCDTPTIQRNIFKGDSGKASGTVALCLTACKLAQINNNSFEGRYERALEVTQDTDASIAGNVISNAVYGIGYSGPNAMVRGNWVMGCSTGIYIVNSGGVIEDVRIGNALRALDIRRSVLQCNDVQITRLPTNGTALFLDSSTVTLLNCNIGESSIRTVGRAAGGVWVQAMNYLVVKVAGQRPVRSSVEVGTAAASGGAPKGGAADLNVRNSPARVNAEGYTPLPRSLRSLIVRSWALGANGKKIDAPFYDVTVHEINEMGAAVKVLKKSVIEPRSTWYRSDPNALEATLEVDLP